MEEVPTEQTFSSFAETLTELNGAGLLPTTEGIWERGSSNFRGFVGIEGREEGMLIDGEAQLIQFPTTIRQSTVRAVLLFSADGFSSFLGGVSLAQLAQEEQIRTSGQRQDLFALSIFLDMARSLSRGVAEIDSHIVH